MGDTSPAVMARMIRCSKYFGGRQQIQVTDMERLAISGGNGAFRQLVADYRGNPKELQVGVAVKVDHRNGETEGAKLLVVGQMMLPEVSTTVFWPEAMKEGTVSFDDLDISVFSFVNGTMETKWNTEIPWKITVQDDGGRKFSLTKGQHQ